MESRFNTDGQATLQARLELQARDVLGYSIAEVFGAPERDSDSELSRVRARAATVRQLRHD